MPIPSRVLARLRCVSSVVWWWLVPVGYVVLIMLRWRDYLLHDQQVDLEVYMRGGRQLLEGVSLYTPIKGELPFTYPPFAAVVFAPLSWLGPNRATVLFLVLSLMGLAVVVHVALRLVATSADASPVSPWMAPLLVLMIITLEPVKYTISLGQVNAMLMALILVDHLLLRGRWQGWLTGVAAGMKIVPAIFILPFVMRRQWAAAARVGAGCTLTFAVGAVAAWADTLRFWGGSFVDPQRVNSRTSLDNQSLYGALSRWWGNHPAPDGVVLVAQVVAAAVVVGLCWRIEQARRAGQLPPLLASVIMLATVGVGSCLISPISWSHHWVWMALVLAVLAYQRRWVAAVAVWVVFYAAIQWVLPGASHTWVAHGITSAVGMPVWQVVLAHSFVIVGVWWLADVAWRLRRAPDQSPQASTANPGELNHAAA